MSKPKQQHPTLSMWVWSLITEFCQTKIATFCLILSFGYTGLSKRNAAKFRELSQNFPKLAGWAVHWQVTLSGCTWDGNFQQWDISFAQPCRMSSLLCTYTSKMLTVSSLSICRQEIERNQAHFVFVHQNPLFSSFLILILWIVTCWPYAQLVRPICMTKNLYQEVWQHFLVTPGLGFMEITKSAHSEVYATLTDIKKLLFYYENGRLFPVFQYFHS